ncbi:DUF2867 domain-containing protein [Lysobacter tyrosinilyticus]
MVSHYAYAAMRNQNPVVSPVVLPAESQISGFYPSVTFADAYAIRLPTHASRDPEVLARFLFARPPSIVRSLLKVRDLLVAPFGIKTADHMQASGASGCDQRIGIFRIYDSNADEIVLGEDDRHLDFRLSVLCRPSDGTGSVTEVVLSTVVKCHNAFGRAYITVVAPFHRAIVQGSLRRAARSGWPPCA